MRGLLRLTAPLPRFLLRPTRATPLTRCASKSNASRPKMASGGDDGEGKRPQFGGRLLTDPRNVFEHNAWDNVVWDEEQEEAARLQVERNSRVSISEEKIEEYERRAAHYWDAFYTVHSNRFFKDRHWLFTEFPELGRDGDDNDDYPGCRATRRILEVGCGAGNTVFPILRADADPALFVYACDFSAAAVSLVRAHADYGAATCHAFVVDVAAGDDPTFPFPDASLDVVACVFVLSAIDPQRAPAAVARLARLLRPGGRLLVRDYGRYDMAQLRFPPGRRIADNFYARGDGTRCYFFSPDDMKALLGGAGLVEESCHVDRRLQVNRGRRLKMYRVWIQCKYRKL
ncbi:PREDICTED: methyltransferase-like protein 2-A [Priapulus caudatus]|uniref:tRNA N(3)-methylcytidine methyltransferase n=1 Tax=Priapulus caudatus TaxID=37621 RepID=A0ABM1ESC7_PRICU|nr:PREDICTED: methyltransferase-like protein 2-A [Priapulus caudatus]